MSDKLRILHITNDYSGSTVYMNLVRELDNLGILQTVYNPIREESKIDKNKINLNLLKINLIELLKKIT